MKKAIVLLLTLSITALLSVLIYHNLSNVDSLINKKISSNNKSEILVIAKKINDDILKVFQNEDFKEEIDKNLPVVSIDLSYKDYLFVINYIEEFIRTESLNGIRRKFYNFDNYIKTLYGTSFNISTHKQLNYIIDSYLLEYEDKELEKIRNDIIVNTGKYICEYTFSYNGLQNRVKIIFKDGEILEFEIWN